MATLQELLAMPAPSAEAARLREDEQARAMDGFRHLDAEAHRLSQTALADIQESMCRVWNPRVLDMMTASTGAVVNWSFDK